MAHWLAVIFNSRFRFCHLVPFSHWETLAIFPRYLRSRGILATCCFIAGILVRRYLLYCKKPLLPGPPVSFFTGNLRQIPKGHPWKTYHEWSRKWGSVLYLRLFGRDVIVFNGVEVAEELLEKRSKIYCNRPTWPMADLIGRQDNVGFTYYGENLKSARKLLHSALGPQSRLNWGPLLEDQTLGLLRQLAASHQAWEPIVKKHVASVIVRFTYGTDATDEYVRLSQEVNRDTGLALQPGWAVDSFPFLSVFPSWLPGMAFKRWAGMARERFYRCTRSPYLATRATVLDQTASPSFVADNLRSVLKDGYLANEKNLMSTAGSIYGAATDTTIAMLMSFFLLMTVHQEIQKKAQAEITSLLRSSRLPTLEDQPNLPYIDALIREIHRFHPVINLVPHSALHDDEYKGHSIPSGVWIMCNVWSMTHDPTVYPDPNVFKPERHLDTPVVDPRSFTFGFGRRSCPGMHFANAHSFLVISRILALFSIKPMRGPDGREHVPTLEYTATFTSQPVPFSCELQVRDRELREFL